MITSFTNNHTSLRHALVNLKKLRKLLLRGAVFSLPLSGYTLVIRLARYDLAQKGVADRVDVNFHTIAYSSLIRTCRVLVELSREGPGLFAPATRIHVGNPFSSLRPNSRDGQFSGLVIC